MLLDFDIAQSRLAAAADAPTRSERVSLHHCSGRILAEPIIATLDLPPSDNSAMDGYAIHHEDFKEGVRFPIQQRSYAGDTPQPLQPGKAIRLFTGSIMPEGANTVVMQEYVAEENDEILITNAPRRDQHVRYQGEDVKSGSEMLAKGTLLGAGEIALLASQGYTDVTVFPQLKVGILTTGDELVSPGQSRKAEQIYNSNGPMLTSMVSRLGGQVVHALHAADTKAAITQAFETLLEDCDLILTVGGVSVGDKDLVKPTIEHLGGKLDLWRVNMKPGRPVALAHVRGKPVVGIPGNPVSAFVVFALLVSPLIRTMQGHAQAMPPVQYGVLETDRVFDDERVAFLRVQARYDEHAIPSLTPHKDQGSAIISSMSWAHGLARLPANTTVKKGYVVRYYDLAHWLN